MGQLVLEVIEMTRLVLGREEAASEGHALAVAHGVAPALLLLVYGLDQLGLGATLAESLRRESWSRRAA